jgi:endonuclease/exonuclease/phosphatase family metal-dependent hydrolase
MRGWTIAGLLLAASAPADEKLVVGFWNVENLFDEFSDGGHPSQPVAKPDELQRRLANRARVVKDLNCDILGLCEVENRRVLRQLVEEPSLKELGYKYYALLDERDERGVDVALIAKRPFFAQSYPIPDFYRGMLVCRFSVDGEPLYVIVNHWKSRAVGGKVGTKPARMKCSEACRELALKRIPEHEGRPAATLVVGDLNDDDFDDSVKALADAGLINAFADYPKEKKWSLAYENRDEKKIELNHFDHLFLNREAADGKKFKLAAGSAEIFKPDYMIRRRRLLGEYRDWPADDYGKVIGYSDHFAVRLTLHATAAPKPEATP